MTPTKKKYQELWQKEKDKKKERVIEANDITMKQLILDKINDEL